MPEKARREIAIEVPAPANRDRVESLINAQLTTIVTDLNLEGNDPVVIVIQKKENP